MGTLLDGCMNSTQLLVYSSHKLQRGNSPQPVYWKKTCYTHIQNVTAAISCETNKFMYDAETRAAPSQCRKYTKCFLPLVSPPRPKTNLPLSLSLWSRHTLSCSFVVKGEQTSLFLAYVFFPLHSVEEKKNKLKTHGGPTAERVSNSIPTPADWLRMSAHTNWAWALRLWEKSTERDFSSFLFFH